MHSLYDNTVFILTIGFLDLLREIYYKNSIHDMHLKPANEMFIKIIKFNYVVRYLAEYLCMRKLIEIDRFLPYFFIAICLWHSCTVTKLLNNSFKK